MNNLSLLGISVLALSLAACNNDPAKGKSQATAAEAVTAAAAPAAGASVKYAFTNADSKLDFVGAKVTRKHDGSFQTFSGTITVVDNDPAKSSVTALIDVGSIKSDDEKLTGHLKSPDLLDVGKFPQATFTSTSIKAGGDKGATHTITGNFQLHGVTKSISFPANVKTSAESVDVDAEFAINRKDFGIVYPGMPDDLIKDDVLLKLQIRAKKAG
ncbi:MAG: Rhodanese-like domain protein [Polyangiaceae bacterium]|jgi:polyisoprenoid-binding protein YceI|nr:Rhodanese-like domain protein [Polyangiaceae bacterium]